MVQKIDTKTAVLLIGIVIVGIYILARCSLRCSWRSKESFYAPRFGDQTHRPYCPGPRGLDPEACLSHARHQYEWLTLHQPEGSTLAQDAWVRGKHKCLAPGFRRHPEWGNQ